MKPKYTDYRIIETTEGSETTARVVILIRNGWVPIGGVCVSTYTDTCYYAQAVALPAEEVQP